MLVVSEQKISYFFLEYFFISGAKLKWLTVCQIESLITIAFFILKGILFSAVQRLFIKLFLLSNMVCLKECIQCRP